MNLHRIGFRENGYPLKAGKNQWRKGMYKNVDSSIKKFKRNEKLTESIYYFYQIYN